MPTDWSARDVRTVRRIKTKFTGNPRYVEGIDSEFTGGKPLSAEPTANLALKDDDNDDDDDYDETEERNDDMKRLESEIFNDPTMFETESENKTVRECRTPVLLT